MSDKLGSNQIEKQPDNIYSGEKNISAAANSYYGYMLNRERYTAISQSVEASDADAKNAMSKILAPSDLDRLAYNIHKRLAGLSDLSPELAQLRATFGKIDRADLARLMAEQQYNKSVVESLMARYVDPAEIGDSSRVSTGTIGISGGGAEAKYNKLFGDRV
jgi:hypothetical protein